MIDMNITIKGGDMLLDLIAALHNIEKDIKEGKLSNAYDKTPHVPLTYTYDIQGMKKIEKQPTLEDIIKKECAECDPDCTNQLICPTIKRIKQARELT
jgi:hypothetical protein